MPLVNKTIKVPKEASELADEAALLLIEIIRAKRNDGKLDGKELLQIVTYLISKIAVIVDGIDEIPGELKAEPYAFALAWAAAGQSISAELNKEVVKPLISISGAANLVSKKKKSVKKAVKKAIKKAKKKK